MREAAIGELRGWYLSMHLSILSMLLLMTRAAMGEPVGERSAALGVTERSAGLGVAGLPLLSGWATTVLRLWSGVASDEPSDVASAVLKLWSDGVRSSYFFLLRSHCAPSSQTKATLPSGRSAESTTAGYHRPLLYKASTREPTASEGGACTAGLTSTVAPAQAQGPTGRCWRLGVGVLGVAAVVPVRGASDKDAADTGGTLSGVMSATLCVPHAKAGTIGPLASGAMVRLPGTAATTGPIDTA